VKVTYERLVNLGNYNNERLSLEDDVQPGETPEQAYQRLRATVHGLLGVPDPKAKHSPLADRERRDAAGIEF
jgi:hypothetical protein